MACALEGLHDDIDSHDLPTALRQLDAPNPAAGPDIECPSVGRLAAALLSLEQFRKPLVERGLLLGVLPRVEVESVGELVVHRVPPDLTA